MYLIKFKESDFDLLAVKELCYIKDRELAIRVADDLNAMVKDVIKKCRAEFIMGCVTIPELDIFILSTSSACSVEAIELKPYEPTETVTYEHLLS